MVRAFPFAWITEQEGLSRINGRAAKLILPAGASEGNGQDSYSAARQNSIIRHSVSFCGEKQG
jgi:hypothetical protein